MALAQRYRTQEPAVVTAELAAAAETVARSFESVDIASAPAQAGARTARRLRSTRSHATSCTISGITYTT